MNTWQITLPQELADFVNEQLARKGWDSPDTLFAAAVFHLQSAMAWHDSMDKDWLRAQLQIGIDQIERGELVDGEEVFARLEAELRQEIEQRS